MGQQSSRHWFQQAQKQYLKRPKNTLFTRDKGPKGPLLGQVERARHLPYAPHILQLTKNTRVICGAPGYRSTSEAVARAIVEFSPDYVVVEDRPDNSCYMRSLNKYDSELEWGRDLGNTENLNGTKWKDLYLVSPQPATLNDITMDPEDLELMASGPVCSDTIESETTTGKLVRWNADADLYCERLTALVNTHLNSRSLGYESRVIIGDLPTSRMFGFLVRTLNFMQLGALIHAATTKHFRQLANRAPQEFMRMLKFSPLLNSVRAKYLSRIVHELSLDAGKRVLVVSSSSQLYPLRYEFSQLYHSYADNQKTSLVRSGEFIWNRFSRKRVAGGDMKPTPLTHFASSTTPQAPEDESLHTDGSLVRIADTLTLQSSASFSKKCTTRKTTQEEGNASTTALAQKGWTNTTAGSQLVAPDLSDSALLQKYAWIFAIFSAPPPAGIAADGPRLDVYSWWINKYNVAPPFFGDLPGSLEIVGDEALNASNEKWSQNADSFLTAFNEARHFIETAGPFRLPGPDPLSSLLYFQDTQADTTVTSSEALSAYFTVGEKRTT
eukprot:gb/GECG01008038.1/.p1 GENE.gb/GECG01008038.1/~~gb/GECG01008038.1/.p1  ORF type:complete len:554 (+),score=49.42 gb/GECG01008038.1/:1-1662(+)